MNSKIADPHNPDRLVFRDAVAQGRAVDLHLWHRFELLYLHFNYHLTRHAAAWVPWIDLPKIAAEPPTRAYLATYLEQWRPPQPLEMAWLRRFQTSGPLPVRHEEQVVPDREPDEQGA